MLAADITREASSVRWLVVGILLILVSACGVKGDPLPPLKPSETGRGEPTYKRATEDLSLPAGRGYLEEENESQAADEPEQEDDDSVEEEY